MQIGKAKHLNTCEDFGKNMNEDSRSLVRHYTNGGIMFSSPKISYMEANTKKDEETGISSTRTALRCA